ncbi:MAG: hypothetical protein ACK4M6_01270 [Hyphomonas sp.]
MDTAPQPTDDDALNALIERARQFILGLILYIDGITARLGDAAMSPALARALTRRAILPAEAALRRVIILLAADLPPITPNPRAIPDGAKQRSGTIPAMNTQPKTAHPPRVRKIRAPPPPKNQSEGRRSPRAPAPPHHRPHRRRALRPAFRAQNRRAPARPARHFLPPSAGPPRRVRRSPPRSPALAAPPRRVFRPGQITPRAQ